MSESFRCNLTVKVTQICFKKRVILFGKRQRRKITHVMFKRKLIRCYSRSGLSQTRISTQGSCEDGGVDGNGYWWALSRQHCPVGFHSLDARVTVYYRSITSQLSLWSQTRQRGKERPASLIAMVIKWHIPIASRIWSISVKCFCKACYAFKFQPVIMFHSVCPCSLLHFCNITFYATARSYCARQNNDP